MENSRAENVINLSVKDFQIIKNASLTFGPGLNAIIGQSNNGKSALFRAAKSCIYNEPGTTSIRNGCSSYAVGLQMNGHTVIYQKGKESIYKIDGNVFQKVGRTQLPEVACSLNIRELNLNGSNEQLNFWDQMEKPFLLDRSETELFRFIVDSGKDNNITLALKTLVSDRQGITKEINMIEGMLSQADITIQNYKDKLVNSDNILDTCNKIIQLGPEIKRLESSETCIAKHKELSDGLFKVNLELNSLNKLLLDVEPMQESLLTKYKKSDLVDKIVNSYRQKQKLLNDINLRINKYEFIGDITLNENLNKYNLLNNIVSRHHELSGKLSDINKIKIPEVSGDFNENAEKLSKLTQILDRRNTSFSNLSKVKDSINEYDLKIKSLKEELDGIGVCPTCGQPIHN